MINLYTAVGVVASSPVLRHDGNGTARLGFELAVKHRWQNKHTQETNEETHLFEVVAWADFAENVGATIHKGMRVVVIGRLEQFSYEQDVGEHQSVQRIAAEEVSPSLRWTRAEVARTDFCEAAPTS